MGGGSLSLLWTRPALDLDCQKLTYLRVGIYVAMFGKSGLELMKVLEIFYQRYSILKCVTAIRNAADR